MQILLKKNYLNVNPRNGRTRFHYTDAVILCHNTKHMRDLSKINSNVKTNTVGDLVCIYL